MNFVGQKKTFYECKRKKAKVITVTNDNTASDSNILDVVKKKLEKVQLFMGTVSGLTTNRIKMNDFRRIQLQFATN